MPAYSCSASSGTPRRMLPTATPKSSDGRKDETANAQSQTRASAGSGSLLRNSRQTARTMSATSSSMSAR